MVHMQLLELFSNSRFHAQICNFENWPYLGNGCTYRGIRTNLDSLGQCYGPYATGGTFFFFQMSGFMPKCRNCTRSNFSAKWGYCFSYYFAGEWSNEREYPTSANSRFHQPSTQLSSVLGFSVTSFRLFR